MRGGALCNTRYCHHATKIGYCNSGATHAQCRACPCSLLPPGDENSVLQFGSSACAVARFAAHATASPRPKFGTAALEPRMRGGAFCRARCCRPATKIRYCNSGSAHARWRALQRSLLPPRDQNPVVQFGSHACAVAEFAALAAAARRPKFGTAARKPRMRGGASFATLPSAGNGNAILWCLRARCCLPVRKRRCRPTSAVSAGARRSTPTSAARRVLAAAAAWWPQRGTAARHRAGAQQRCGSTEVCRAHLPVGEGREHR